MNSTPHSLKSTPSTAKASKSLASTSKIHANNTQPKLQFRGEQFTEKDVLPNDDRQDHVPYEWTFGFKNLQYISPKTGQWTPLSLDNDKFLVNAPTLQEARSEFYSRWSLYLHQRFGIRFAHIN